MELTDLDADHQLLELPGVSLVVFTSEECDSCRLARKILPSIVLPVIRLCWIDAERNAGLVSCYEVFYLPALFLVRDGFFMGPVQCRLLSDDLATAIGEALTRPAEELP
ncbi:thioredoxin family protein [Pseudomonas sp. NCCP-436]|uniref:thioredoxin family protein n=1 Tax=Pseudomonas sp. NCCP-436 TaxID=2842481 RepID=UPI001C802BC9|nr:thioredoxin family protein [Pseudomonas sp. NCCP-436]GIZ11769.1 thiol reductase thioredoxin [Pseudomonas sp. NCCP-436]